ncbi:MAG: Ig-like domain-containing protein, partial [Ruminococcus sp.]
TRLLIHTYAPFETAKHVTIRAKDLSIDSSKRDNAYAMVLIGGGTSEQKSADVTLILEGENTFKGGWGKAGITVGPGKKLTIEGSGTVTAIGGDKAAGIGGEYNNNCGEIIINSGTVIAKGRKGGSMGAAGIGGGYNGNGGNITINGGSVTATSDGYGAGIGGGDNGGNGGNITINGGTVNATSWTHGAGIGGGLGGSGGNITINGGYVTAKSIDCGAGIGGGRVGHGGDIIINGGTVTAISNSGAGIGDGEAAQNSSGTFSTAKDGKSGNAVIFAKSISDQSGKNNNLWSGIIFEGNSGKVYGTSVTPTDDFTIEKGKTLTIDNGKLLIISEDVTMVNAGTINNNGKIYVDGTFTGTADNLYYPLTLVKATATENTSVYNTKTYGKAGSEITLTPDTPPTGYAFDKWEASPASVTIGNDNKFTMPNKAITVAAQYKDIAAPVISGVEDGKTYCSAQTVTVSDNDAIDRVTVNGTEVTLDERNQFTLSPANGTQEIIATDKAGNRKTVTVAINDGHTDVNTDHACDYCDTNVGTHTDTNRDHKCDYGCSVAIGTHADTNRDHKCDYGCSVAIGVHADTNNDHNCDYCHEQMTICKDDNKDHLCDICGATLSRHSGGTATCTNKAICDICGKPYGELDSTNHNLEHIPAKKATVTQEGNIEYWHCKDCGKYFSDKDGKKTIELKDTVIAKLPAENEQSCFAPLMLKAASPKDKTVKLTWTKLKGVKGYIVYGVRCGNDLKKIKTVKGNSYTIKNLKKGKYYKYMVVAYKTVNGKQVTISNSKVAHVAVKGGKYGNVTKITVNKINPIKQGKKLTLKATVKYSKKNVKTHVPIRYESTNTKIATVNSKGVITAKAKGVCYIYVYAQNGVYKKVKVTVK